MGRRPHPDQLPEDHHCAWREEAEALRDDLDVLTGEVGALKTELAQLRRAVFGKKSEKIPAVREQLRVGDGRNSPAATARRRERAEAKAQLPEVLVHHRVPADQRTCPKCGSTQLRSLGEGKTTTVIEYIPSQLVQQVHVQETLSCRCGEGIITAEGASKVVDKGHYGPGFIAHAVVAKCADSIPLYRLEKIYGRHGAPIHRSTLIGLFHAAAKLVDPIARHLLAKVAASPLVNADETPIRVQAPGQCRRGYLWTFVSGKDIAYQFSASRSGDTPSKVLGASEGALVVDGYTGYNEVTQPGRRQRIGCWAHVRRKIFDARDTASEQADRGLALIAELYRVEHDAMAANVVRTEQHRVLRQLRSAVLIEQIAAWLVAMSLEHGPRSPFGKAVRYAGRQWVALTRFLEDPALPLDNNAAERALRVAALGRKNFLFVGSDEGGENLASLYTLIATCEANRINAFRYLRDVLIRVQTHPQSKIDDLLPQRWVELFGQDSS
jgi:transposase